MGLSFESKRIKLGLNITYYRRAKKITQIQLADYNGPLVKTTS